MKGLQNLRQWLQRQSMISLQFSNGGSHRISYINAAIFISIFIFNTIDIFANNKGVERLITYSMPFLILFIVSIVFKKDIIDTILNIIIAIMLLLITPYGDLSAIVFVMYVLYRLRDHRQFIVFGTVVFVLLVVSAFIQKVTVLQVSLSFAGYLYAVAKYYYIIHKPTKRSKCRIKYLENKLNILGPAEPLTNYQIETLYPFMSERRIKDLRQLAIGKSAKDLQYENGITYSAQTKEHNTMREKLGRVTDQDITSVAQLVRVGIEVGIIQVNYVKHTH